MNPQSSRKFANSRMQIVSIIENGAGSYENRIRAERICCTPGVRNWILKIFEFYANADCVIKIVYIMIIQSKD